MTIKDIDKAVAAVKQSMLHIQHNICQSIQEIDGGEFKEDQWERAEGGGGITRILENSTVIEKGGVNFSHVHGAALPASASAARPELAGRSFQAMGVSVVMHPNNPYAPTAHMNVRFFLAEKQGEAPIWWFGGGFDLTPYYGFDEDCIHWHTIAKEACDSAGNQYYRPFKTGCDDYFYLKHRNEPRGIGGIFYDDFNELGFEKTLSFTEQVGAGFIRAYAPILGRRATMPFEEKEKEFQLHRRGRYVEFNLVFDRGTLFGLQSGGRTESILMSLPPDVKWSYDWRPDENSDEAKLTAHYLKAKDWI